MQQLIRNILFIDDQCEAYLPALEPVAYEAGFSLCVYEKVTDSIEFLKDYASVVDAIILDLSFPEGEIQGKEGLIDITRLFPQIPIIILTDSDSTTDLNSVVDCMKLGAYNYIGKSTLDPVYLFEVVKKAIEDYQRKRYLFETKRSADDKSFFHTFIQKTHSDNYSHLAIFGFELISVTRPSGTDYPDKLLQKAEGWHQKLLKAINTPYKDNLKINLRYINESNTRVICRIFFSVYAESQTKLLYLVRNVQEDVKLLFIYESHSNDYLYSFLGSGTDFQARHPSNLMRFTFDTNQPENQLPYCYLMEQVMQSFRIPLPDREKIEGVSLQPATFGFLPDNLPDNGFRMGEKLLYNGKRKIRADSSMLSRHLYIMGQTGTGKTTLMKTMIMDCINHNKGFALIDPHGDLFSEIVNKLTQSQKKKTFIIDTVNPDKSAKYNPLSYDLEYPQTKSLIINELLRIADNLYNLKETGGPMFELYFRQGLLLILNNEVQKSFGQSTLKTFTKIFYNSSFCKELLNKCDDQQVIEFFDNAFDMRGEVAFENIAPYITSKMTRFTDDLYIKQIINSGAENINFRHLIDAESIFLVKMDKGLIGSTNASFLGQLIISSILMAAMSRSDIPVDERKPFHVFIDEFQNFVQGDIATAFAEARKYGLRLIMANQTLGQLNKYVMESLLGNVGSFVFFRPGINDYGMIRHYLEPEFERRDVLKLPNFNCIARLLIDNIPSDPFVFQTIK